MVSSEPAFAFTTLPVSTSRCPARPLIGERMKPAHYTEMTAVCVHPSHRGRVYGQMLLSAVSRQIVARGETPFLHVFTSNHSAIALYRRQGMEIRRRLHVTVLKKED